MRNRIAQQKRSDVFNNALYRETGRLQNVLFFSSEAEVSLKIPDVSKLPCAFNDTELQDEDGNFYFMSDYSHSDGPDIIA